MTLNDESILFYDGTVTCLQRWQYGVIFAVCVFILPFFIVLLFGPKLMAAKKLSVPAFIIGCLFPLFMAVPIVTRFIKIRKQPLPISDDDDNAYTERVRNGCDVRINVVQVVTGAYRQDIYDGVCWEGVINLRRLVVVLLFTLVNDALLKQVSLVIICFIILMVHVRFAPPPPPSGLLTNSYLRLS